MKFSNADALAILEVLADANETGKLGFVIAKNRRKFSDELKEFCDIRESIINKYGNILLDGKFTIEKDNIPDFVEELKPYGEMECDIQVVKVDEETFISGSLTSKQMYVLEWMIEDENDKKKEGS